MRWRGCDKRSRSLGGGKGGYSSQGLITVTPLDLKSLRLRVNTVSPCIRAVLLAGLARQCPKSVGEHQARSIYA